MTEDGDAKDSWTRFLPPPKYVGAVLVAAVSAFGALRGVENTGRIEHTEERADDYVTRAVFRAVVDSLNRRVATAEQAYKAARAELRRPARARALTASEQREVEQLLVMGPPEPPKKGTLLRSLLKLFPGV